MDQVRILLRDVNFPHLHVDSTELEEIILKPGQDRLRLLQWCLSEIDEDIKNQLLNVRDNELEDALLMFTKGLGLCLEHDRDIVLGLGQGECQIAFWQKLLHVLKCVQHTNKLSTEQEMEMFSNTSKTWHDLIQSLKFKESLNMKMNLIPIEMKIGVQQQTCSLASIIADKHSLEQHLQALKSQKPNTLTADTPSNNNIDITGTPIDLKASTTNVKELSNIFNNLLKSELKLQHYQPHCNTDNKQAKALDNAISCVSGQTDNLTRIVNTTESVVEALEATEHSKNIQHTAAVDENLTKQINLRIKHLEGEQKRN